jgi:uncharacterized protein YidB (DUF937 family)
MIRYWRCLAPTLKEGDSSEGLGDVVSSWIGTGQNQPVTGEQIASVLGSVKVQQFAQKLGFSSEDISKGPATIS